MLRPRSRDWQSGRQNAREGESFPLIDSDLARFKRYLHESTSTVIELLEELCGEVIIADVVRQHLISPRNDNELGAGPEEEVIHRTAILRGYSSGRDFLLADSIFVPCRLPGPVRSQLAQRVEPIGRVLVAHKLRLKREPLADPERFDANTIYSEGDFASDVVWSRAYRLTLHGNPVFAIREWFLEPVLEALSRQPRSDDVGVEPRSR